MCGGTGKEFTIAQSDNSNQSSELAAVSERTTVKSMTVVTEEQLKLWHSLVKDVISASF